MIPIDSLDSCLLGTVRSMSFLSSPLLYCGRQLGLSDKLGRDRKFWRRNETLCIDVTEYAELKSALVF
jgi:hypothetical protein